MMNVNYVQFATSSKSILEDSSEPVEWALRFWKPETQWFQGKQARKGRGKKTHLKEESRSYRCGLSAEQTREQMETQRQKLVNEDHDWWFSIWRRSDKVKIECRWDKFGSNG